ncbi:recombinase family protein [Cupriavidus necator]|nr:recombinase family protein [Cupriavidus necator]UIF89148.1 recombinase family protein [Cupriavidus necator]UIF89475.1 recombinase family protein [Cupriavidus necator]UIF89490.1 recombinase family protein [Cupriavidus necator]UIF91860.1 recombinase family protein [Cupriavidus necator]
MTDTANKIGPSHLQRTAFVYIRQSSASQVEHNRESTQRQYALAQRATALGWTAQQVSVIDEDLGLSGASAANRGGFARMTAEVALGHAGIILGLEVSRLARNNSDWYRLLDLCSMTDTLIGDADGVYNPALFNDRLLLGLKGTMSEAELHILRARLDGGIRNKAARGELRRGLPIGLVWGEAEGEVRLHPDEAVVGALRAVFERFSEFGSARRVWLWFRAENLSFPLQLNHTTQIRWVAPTYTAIYNVLTNPVYAGAYCYGKTRQERYVDEHGVLKTRLRRLPQSQWAVLIRDHHEGYLDWMTYEANQMRLGANTKPRPHQAGGAVREGAALLQGLACCGHCGRRLKTHYRGTNQTPGYHCSNKGIENGRGVFCLNVGGLQIDAAVAQAFLQAVEPAGIAAAVRAAERLEADHDAALAQWRLNVERAHYEAQRAERRYHAVDPENRLVARGLETQWEQQLRELEQAQAELARREQLRPCTLSTEQRKSLLAIGKDLKRLWDAPTLTLRDRKQLLRTLLEEVSITVHREQYRAHLKLRWRGGKLTDCEVALPRSRPATIRTDEDTIALVRRLAEHYPDATIAGILNTQGRVTARGLRFNQSLVGNLRRHWQIPCFERPTELPDGELLSIRQAARVLGTAPSTLHRWVNDGFIAGEQTTPGAPWRIRITDALRQQFVAHSPDGYVVMQEATKLLGVSRQTVLQRVKRGELDAVLVCQGRRKGLRIKAVSEQPDLFEHAS